MRNWKSYFDTLGDRDLAVRRRNRAGSGLDLIKQIVPRGQLNKMALLNRENVVGVSNWKRKWKSRNENMKKRSHLNHCYTTKLLLIVIVNILLITGASCGDYQLENSKISSSVVSSPELSASLQQVARETTPNSIEDIEDNELRIETGSTNSNSLQQLPPITEDANANQGSTISSIIGSTTTTTTTNRPSALVATTADSSDGSTSEDAISQLIGSKRINMDSVDYIATADLVSPTSVPGAANSFESTDSQIANEAGRVTATDSSQAIDQDALDHSNPLHSSFASTTNPTNFLDEVSLDENNLLADETRWSSSDENARRSTIAADGSGQLVRNRKSSELNSTKVQDKVELDANGAIKKAPNASTGGSPNNTINDGRAGEVIPPLSSASISENNLNLKTGGGSSTADSISQMVPTFGSIDYDDFDSDYQLKVNSAADSPLSSGSNATTQQNLNKRDYDTSMSTVKPPNWSALIRQQPHVFTSTASSRFVPASQQQADSTTRNGSQSGSNQTQPMDFYHQTPAMIPSLLTVKSTQLTNQELNKVRPHFLLFQDEMSPNSYISEQSQALANGDLLATASGTGIMNTQHPNGSDHLDLSSRTTNGLPRHEQPIISLLNGSPVKPTGNNNLQQTNGTRALMSEQQVTTIVVDNVAATTEPTFGQQEANPITRLPLGTSQSSMSNNGSHHSTASISGRQAPGHSHANQWFNYPHPNLHHNPLLLHHILNKPSVYAQHVGANSQQAPISGRDTQPASTTTSTSSPAFANLETTSMAAPTGNPNQPAPVTVSNIIEKPTLSADQSNQPTPINRTQLQMQLNEMRNIASSELKQRQKQQQRPPVGPIEGSTIVGLSPAASLAQGHLKQAATKQQLATASWLKLNQPFQTDGIGINQIPRNTFPQNDEMALQQSLRQASHNQFARFSSPQVSLVRDDSFMNPNFVGSALIGGSRTSPQGQLAAEFAEMPLLAPGLIGGGGGATTKMRLPYPPMKLNVMHHLFGNSLAGAGLNSPLNPLNPIRAAQQPVQMIAPKSFGDTYQNHLFEGAKPTRVFAPLPPHLMATASKVHNLHHHLPFEQAAHLAPNAEDLSQFSAYLAHQQAAKQLSSNPHLASQVIAAPSSLREVYTPRPASMAGGSAATNVTPCPQHQQSQSGNSRDNYAESLLKQLNLSGQLSNPGGSQSTPAVQSESSTTSNMSEEDMSTYVAQLASLSAQQQPANGNQQPASSMEQASWQSRDPSFTFNPGQTSEPTNDGASLELQVASLLQQLKPVNSSIDPISSQSELEALFLQKPSDSLTINGLNNNPNQQQATSWADLLKHAKLIGLPDEVQAQIYQEHLSPLAIRRPPAALQQRHQLSPGGAIKQSHGPPYSALMNLDSLASNKFAVHQAAPETTGSPSGGGGGLVWRRPANEMTAASLQPLTMLSNQSNSTGSNSPKSSANEHNQTNDAEPSTGPNYSSLDGHQRQQKKDREHQEEIQRQRQKQITFIEALRSSLMRMHSAQDGLNSPGKSLHQTAATSQADNTMEGYNKLVGSDSMDNLTLAASSGQDEFDEQANNPIPDWLERQLIQESLIHETARVHPFGHTSKSTYLGRPTTWPPLASPVAHHHQMLGRPAATILRPVTSNPHASHLGPRPVYPLIPLAPPSPHRILPSHHHFERNHLHHHHASPISILRQLGSHNFAGYQHHQPSPLAGLLPAASQPMSSLQANPFLPPSPHLSNPTRLFLDRFPLASAPAYLIKLPTLTGGTITASGSLLPPQASKLMRGTRPGSPLRLLNAAASMAPQRMKLVSSMMQSAPSIAHAFHQPPPHHFYQPPGVHHGLHRYPGSSFGSLAASMAHPMYSAGQAFDFDTMHSMRPVPVHLHPLHHHHYLPAADTTSHNQYDPISLAQSNQQSMSQMGSSDMASSQPASFAPSSNVSLGFAGSSVQNQPASTQTPLPQARINTSARLPVDEQQYTQNGYYSPPPPANVPPSSSVNEGPRYSISAGNHQLTLSANHQSPQSSAVTALNRLQQATASLVELTSLASLVEEMVGGSDIESSPAAALANAINSLSAAQNAAMNAQASTGSSGAVTAGGEQQQLSATSNKQPLGPPLAPFSWKNLLAASIWRDKSSGKARDLNALERLVVAARRPNSARLKVKYIRVPVAVYETTSTGGGAGDNANGNQLVTKTQLAEILAQNGASNGALNLSAQPVSSDTNIIPASNSATSPSLATVTPAAHQVAQLLAGSTGGSLLQASLSTASNNNNNNNQNQNQHQNNANNNANSVSEASSADYLFDELSADSVPHIALALHDHILTQPSDQSKEALTGRMPSRIEYLPMLAGLKPVPVLTSKKLVSLGTQGLSPLESAIHYTMLDPSASGSAPVVEVKTPKTSSATKRRKKKKNKKEEDNDDESEDEDDDDDLLTSNDLSLLESAISTLIHGGPVSHMPPGGAYQPPYPFTQVHPSQMGWRSRSPFGLLKGEASTNIESYASPNAASPGFSLNPFGKHSHRFSIGEVAGALGARKLISSLLSKRKVSRTSKREANHNATTTRLRPSSMMTMNEAKSSSEKPHNLFYTSTEPSSLEQVGEQTKLRYPVISPHDLGMLRSTRKPERSFQRQFANISPKPAPIGQSLAGVGSDSFSVELKPKPSFNDATLQSNVSTSTTTKPVAKRFDFEITSSSSEVPPELKQLDTEAPVHFDFYLKSIHDNGQRATTSSTKTSNSTQPATSGGSDLRKNHEPATTREKERNRKEIMAMPLYHVVADHFSKLHSGPSSSMNLAQKVYHDQNRVGTFHGNRNKKVKKS